MGEELNLDIFNFTDAKFIISNKIIQYNGTHE